MQNTLDYLESFYMEMMNCILNAPTDEATIEYLSTCLKETYKTTLETVHAEMK